MIGQLWMRIWGRAAAEKKIEFLVFPEHCSRYTDRETCRQLYNWTTTFTFGRDFSSPRLLARPKAGFSAANYGAPSMFALRAGRLLGEITVNADNATTPVELLFLHRIFAFQPLSVVGLLRLSAKFWNCIARNFCMGFGCILFEINCGGFDSCSRFIWMVTASVVWGCFFRIIWVFWITKVHEI